MKYFLLLCFLSLAFVSSSQNGKITVSGQFLLPLAYQSPVQDHPGPEFHAPRNVLVPTVGGEIAYTKNKHLFSLIAKQGVIGSSYQIDNNLAAPYISKLVASDGINQLILSLCYGQLLSRKVKFLFKTSLHPYWQAGVGYGFNRSDAYYAEQYNNITFITYSIRDFTSYDEKVYKAGGGVFLIPKIGFKILSHKKQKEIFNLNFFYDYGLRGQANYVVQYSIGTYNANGGVSQIKNGSVVLTNKGQSFGLSLSTPLYSFKTRK